MDLEVNVPTFFSVAILLVATLMLSAITVLQRRSGGQHIFVWALLSGGFAFMALDEMASIHERMIEPMRAILGVTDHGLLYYAWVVPAIGLVAVLAAFFPKFLADLPKKYRYIFIAGGHYVPERLRRY